MMIELDEKEREVLRLVLNQIKRTTFTLSVLVAVFVLAVGLKAAWAGPPFLTDDPEPVEHQHGELYLATQYSNAKDGVFQTAPHVEFNYGIFPNAQFHLIVPFAYSHPKDSSKAYGLSDIEVGIKYRFIEESGWRPQIGTFPLVEIPSGSSSKGLGEGHTKFLIPLWLQKSWGEWTTYGGGGYWHNPGPDNKNYWFAGWVLQREITKAITVGAELFHATKSKQDSSDRTGFNVGAIINLSEDHHILFSVGRDFHGDNLFTFYTAYQLTFGPKEKAKAQ